MATSTSSRPLIGMAADDPEGDADTEGSGSSDNLSINSAVDSEQTGSHEKEPLSMKRRIAFVGALLLCVFTIFAFAFLLPCHKPQCQKFPVCPGRGDLSSVNWTDKFGGITPGIISLLDVTGDGRSDILVEFDIEEKESKNSSFLNQLCKSKNCHGGGVLAIDGSCGNSLWVFSRNSSFELLACESVAVGKDVNDRHCLLLEEKVKLVLFNVGDGTTKWQSESPSSQKIFSFKFVNDVDADGVRDIVFVNEQRDSNKEGNINLLSGKTGKGIGSSLPFPDGHSGNSVLAVHASSSTKQFVIVGSISVEDNGTSLWAISVHDLSEKVKDPTKVIPGEPWGKHRPDPATGFISILKDSFVLVQPLLADLDADGVKDVIFLIKKNGTSLLAMSGNDLTIMWKIFVPSDASVHKLFQSRHSVQENSTSVVLFVAYANDSTSLLVINGPTGGISWPFHSSTGLPVPPIPVFGVSDTQQAFVIWLPKSETLSLIPKHRKSRQIQQDSYDHDFVLHDDNDGYFFGSNDFGDEEYDDDDDGVTSNEFVLGLIQEILDENTNDSPLSQKQFVDTYNKGDNVLLSTRKENIPGIQERGYNEDLVPFFKKQFSGIEEDVGPQEERSDEQGDPEIHTSKLEWDLSDLTNHKNNEASVNNQKKVAALNSHHKKDEISSNDQKNDGTSSNSHQKDDTSVSIQKKDKKLFSNHKKDETPIRSQRTTARAFASRIHSIPKVSKEQHLEPIREEKENDFLKASMRNMIQNSQFITENDKQENSKLGLFKKPSYHKRSVQTSPSGTQCVRNSDDDAESYVALLLLKDGEGKQQIVEITEEGPLYLDSEEYESLFNVKKSDAKSTSCLRLLPSLVSEPALRDTEEGLDLVYTVSFVSEDGSIRVGKVRKMTMAHVFQSLKNKKITVTVKAGKHQSKRENDYSFSFPRILK